MTQKIEPLDLVAIREVAERFSSAAGSDDCTVKEYVDTYNAYTRVVGVDTVLLLLEIADRAAGPENVSPSVVEPQSSHLALSGGHCACGWNNDEAIGRCEKAHGEIEEYGWEEIKASELHKALEDFNESRRSTENA